jgi:glycosyltransferase involved in cell wall biosynthesis
MAASITIIIAARNAADTLAETLESVRRQTRTDWVVHVVDDGSTDDTASIAAEFGAVDERFRLFQVAAGGVGAARNYAALRAETPWLAFLDADDLYRDDFVAEMLGRASESPMPERTVTYCWVRHITPDRRFGRAYRPPRTEHLLRLRTGCIFYTCAVVIPRGLFNRVGGYDESLRTAEDWDLWLRIFQCEPLALEVEQPLAVYRMRPGSLSRTSSRMFCDARGVIERAYGDEAGEDQLARIRRTVFLVGLWHLGFSIGSEQADREYVHELPMPNQIDWSIAADHVISGITMGACQLDEDWPMLWQKFKDAIAADLNAVGLRCGELLEALESRAGVSA